MEIVGGAESAATGNGEELSTIWGRGRGQRHLRMPGSARHRTVVDAEFPPDAIRRSTTP